MGIQGGSKAGKGEVTPFMSLRLKHFLCFSTVLLTIAACAAVAAIGPRHIRGRWVRRRIEWYGIGLGLPIVYPGVVDYVYRDGAGNLIRHGPYRRYVLDGIRFRLQSEGFFDNGLPDGTFTEWNTQDGTKMVETFYVRGKQIGDSWYQQGKLFQYRLDLYDGDRRIATKTFSNGRWFLDKVSACLTFTIDSQSGELRYLDRVVCQ